MTKEVISIDNGFIYSYRQCKNINTNTNAIEWFYNALEYFSETYNISFINIDNTKLDITNTDLSILYEKISDKVKSISFSGYTNTINTEKCYIDVNVHLANNVENAYSIVLITNGYTDIDTIEVELNLK